MGHGYTVHFVFMSIEAEWAETFMVSYIRKLDTGVVYNITVEVRSTIFGFSKNENQSAPYSSSPFGKLGWRYFNARSESLHTVH